MWLMCENWPHHRGLRPLLLSNSGVGSFTSHKNHWDKCKCCETEPTVFRPYPRRLESRTVCRCDYKGSTFFSVIFKDPECWSGRGSNPWPPALQTGALPTELTRRQLRVLILQLTKVHIMARKFVALCSVVPRCMTYCAYLAAPLVSLW